ncbi:MAG TPA: CUAEP/CCAEP-tail radical SAM protein [Gemmatimonadales bacterium]|nr:CUAEP/CCAEP-tail radical SAM protein [Gemmatimonadales bacterium]
MTSLRTEGAVLLISCYELGHQPLGLAWPLAFLERAGYAPSVMDLAIGPFDDDLARAAQFVGIAVPMHTAMRLGVRAAMRIKRVNPDAFICFYGLYAALNARYLLGEVGDACLGGETEERLLALLTTLEEGARPERAAQVTVSRLSYPVPARAPLEPLARYVHLERAGTRTPAGYVEASRGCLHECLHCPIPPVYGGRFVAVPRDVVMEDIRGLVRAGAGHITFGDPDFLNGPTHSAKLVEALHAEFPDVTWDATTKIEHILAHPDLINAFGRAGCVFLVSAVESLSDVVLAKLEKGHTRADVVQALGVVRGAGIVLRPSFVAFTPWTTLADYVDVLDFVAAHDLIDEVDPVQFAIRLLIPPGSLLLKKGVVEPFLGPLDPRALTYPWVHPDPRMDALHAEVTAIVARGAMSARDAFARLCEAAGRVGPVPQNGRARSPRLTEPWFCCAEPTDVQIGAVDLDPGHWV